MLVLSKVLISMLFIKLCMLKIAPQKILRYIFAAVVLASGLSTIIPTVRLKAKNTILLRRSGRAVCLYCTAHKTQLTIYKLEDFLTTPLFPDLLTPNPLADLLTISSNVTIKLRCLHRTPFSAVVRRQQRWMRRPTLAADLASVAPLAALAPPPCVV